MNQPMDQYCLSDRKNKTHSEFSISFWNKQTNDHAMTNDQYEPYHTILKHIELVDRYIILHEAMSETEVDDVRGHTPAAVPPNYLAAQRNAQFPPMDGVCQRTLESFR
eukprot:132970_1